MAGVGASLTRSSLSPPTTTTLQITNHDFDITDGGEVVYYYPGETFTASENPLICTGSENKCVVTPSYIVENNIYSEFNILVVDLKEDVQQSLDFLFAGNCVALVVKFFCTTQGKSYTQCPHLWNEKCQWGLKSCPSLLLLLFLACCCYQLILLVLTLLRMSTQIQRRLIDAIISNAFWCFMSVRYIGQ